MDEHDLPGVLLNKGVRPTQQRIAVYQYLLTHPTHPSADTIYQALSKRFPVFSRTTIYNSLNSLLEAGLIRTVSIRSNELLYDANTTDHGHFLCSGCDKLFDFPVEQKRFDDLLPEHFESNQADIFFSGRCPDCIHKGHTK